MSTVTRPMTEIEREARISHLVRLIAHTEDAHEVGRYWDEMTALIAQRSPEQVRRMEVERGLN